MNFGIIAAGQGSRLAQEGVELPKPLVSINGTPMIGRLIRLFLDCGAESLTVIVNEEMTEVADFISSLAPTLSCPLDLIVKSTPSSMHSFFEVAKRLEGKGRFIVTTVDTIFREQDFRPYARAFQNAPDNIDGMMAVTSYIDDEKPLYVATDSENRITAFLDKKQDDVRFISGGIYGLGNSALPVLEKCLAEGVHRMRNYQRALVEAGLNLRAFDLGKIVDVDHASDIAVAENFLKS